jgi:hypothetical protein
LPAHIQAIYGRIANRIFGPTTKKELNQRSNLDLSRKGGHCCVSLPQKNYEAASSSFSDPFTFSIDRSYTTGFARHENTFARADAERF